MALTPYDKKSIFDLIAKECEAAGTTAENLLCALEACCIMKALTVIAQCTVDFSLRKAEDDQTWSKLKESESFKSSLYQVINLMSEAFRTADNSMYTIQLTLSRMPDSLNDIAQAIDQFDQPESPEIIDQSLILINEITATCAEAATGANKKCSEALEFIQELLASTIATQGRNEHRAVAAIAEHQKQQDLEQQKKEFLFEMQMKYEEQKGIARQALEDYKTNLNSEITDVLTIMVVTNLVNLVNSIGKTAENVGTAIENLSARSVVLLKEEFLNGSKTLLNQDDIMCKAMENVLIELIDNIIKQSDEEIIEQCETHINHLAFASQYKISTELGKILQEISKQLMESLQSLKNDEPDSRKKFVDAKIAAELYLKSFEKAVENAKDAETSKRAATQEQLALMKLHEERLKTCREDVDRQRKVETELRKEVMLAREELANIMGGIQRLRMEQVNLDQIIKYLYLGMQQLTRIQTAWKNIVTFFDHIRNTVEHSLVPHVKNVTSSITVIKDSGRKSVGNMHRRILFREISKANGISNILMKSAELYTTISKQYVTPLLGDSIKNFGMKQNEAKEQQHFITYNFDETTEKVQNAVTLFNQTLLSNVYEAMQQQQFDVGNAITN